MKKIGCLLLVLFCFLCASCSNIVPDYKENEETPVITPGGSPSDNPDQPSYDILPEVEYNEAPDSVEGVDVTDLSGLKSAIDKVGNNYASMTKVYFNALAVERVIYNYKKPFYCQVTSLYNKNYVYQYNQTFEHNVGYVNYNNNIYTVSLNGVDLPTKLNSNIDKNAMTLFTENKSISDQFFTLDELNSSYVDKYGPTTIVYTKDYSVDYLGWTRIGENKYKCDRPEVIEDFLNICSPGFDNGGTYMTYRYVTVEVNPGDGYALRLRLYASPTQIGKLIASHKNPENTNWYLLFAEAYIYDVNNVEPNAFENLYR